MRYSHEDYDEAIKRAKKAAEEARHTSYEQAIRRGEQNSSKESGRSCGVITVRDGEVLAAIRKTEDGYGEICGPGGGIHEGESPIDGAKRELAEEFGLKAKSICPLRYGEEEDKGEKPYLFLCTKFEGDPECKDGELESPMFLSMEELAAIRPSCFKPFYESIEYLNKALRYDDEEDEERDRGQESGGHGNTRLPYGLCQRYGIELPSGATPHDAWQALAGKGITPENAYKTLKETGSAEGIGQEPEQMQEAEQTQETGTTGQAQGNEEAQPQEIGQEEQESEEAQGQESEGTQIEEGEQGEEAEDPRLKEMNDKFKDLETKAKSGEIDTGLYGQYTNELKNLVRQVGEDDVLVVERSGILSGKEYWFRTDSMYFISNKGDRLSCDKLAESLRYDKFNIIQKSASVMKMSELEAAMMREVENGYDEYKGKEKKLIDATLDGMLNFKAPGTMAWNEVGDGLQKYCQSPYNDAKKLLNKTIDGMQDNIDALKTAKMFGMNIGGTANVLVNNMKNCKDLGGKSYLAGAKDYFDTLNKVRKLASGADEVMIGDMTFTQDGVFGEGRPWAEKKDELREKCRYLMAQFVACPKDVAPDEVDEILADNDARIKTEISDELDFVNEEVERLEKLKESGDEKEARISASVLGRQCSKSVKEIAAGRFGDDFLIDEKCEAEAQAFKDAVARLSESFPVDANDRYDLPDLPIDKSKGVEKFDESSYSQERKDGAKWCQTEHESVATYGKQARTAFKTATKDEREAVWEYTAGSGKFNRPLSGYHGTWKSEDFKGIGMTNLNHEGGEKMIQDLTNFLGRNSFDTDIWVQHGFDNMNGLAAFLGMDPDDVSEDSINELVQSGSPCHWSSFMSCGAAKDTGFDNCSYVLNVYCPKGTKGAYIAPGSTYGGSHDFTGTPPPPVKAGHENELLLQRDGNYRITKCEKNVYGWYLDVEVVDQTPYDYSNYKYKKP